jgi:hypothetical protein
MAIHLKATYVKKLGLPQYSSHQYSVEVSAELTDISQVSQASADLYARLQQAVDAQIVKPGYIPGDPIGTQPSPASLVHAPQPNVHNHASPAPSSDEEAWRCSDKQRDLILKIVAEHSLDKGEIDALARQRFGAGVKQLNKLQASGLIDELLETHGHASNGAGHNRHRNQAQGGGVRRDYARPAYQGRGRS